MEDFHEINRRAMERIERERKIFEKMRTVASETGDLDRQIFGGDTFIEFDDWGDVLAFQEICKASEFETRVEDQEERNVGSRFFQGKKFCGFPVLNQNLE